MSEIEVTSNSDVPLSKNNKTGLPVTNSATRDATISFASEIAYFIHIFEAKKIAKKLKVPTFIRRLGKGSP